MYTADSSSLESHSHISCTHSPGAPSCVSLCFHFALGCLLAHICTSSSWICMCVCQREPHLTHILLGVCLCSLYTGLLYFTVSVADWFHILLWHLLLSSTIVSEQQCWEICLCARGFTSTNGTLSGSHKCLTLYWSRERIVFPSILRSWRACSLPRLSKLVSPLHAGECVILHWVQARTGCRHPSLSTQGLVCGWMCSVLAVASSIAGMAILPSQTHPPHAGQGFYIVPLTEWWVGSKREFVISLAFQKQNLENRWWWTIQGFVLTPSKQQ